MMFGIPMNVDTGSNESHHKTTKIAAKLTQKDIRTFEQQTSNRLDDFHVLNLAMEEIKGNPLWSYLDSYKEESETDEAEEGTKSTLLHTKKKEGDSAEKSTHKRTNEVQKIKRSKSTSPSSMTAKEHDSFKLRLT
jgi:hypothetical protein